MNRIITLLSILFYTVCIFAQEKIVHEKKLYKAPDGKLYIQKELPVYIWLSTSPDEKAQKYRLYSEETPQYNNPMYFDTEGYNTVRSPSAVDTSTKKTVYPLRDIIFEVYTDSKAPSTKIEFGDGSEYVKDGKTYISKDAHLNITSRDATSGVNVIYYSINQEPFQVYKEPIPLSEEKEYLVKYYAIDNVGNDEEIHEITIVYDKSSPTSKLEIIGDEHETVISGRSKLKLSSVDVGVGMKKTMYSIDDNPEKVYKTEISAVNLAQGGHTIRYYGIDQIGNTESVKTYEFYIDKTPPTIIEEVLGKSFFANGKEFSSGKSRLKLTSFDNKAGVKEIKYSINGSEYKVYDKPVFLTQASGNLLIKAYAVDNVNNKSASQIANEKTTIPYIDLTGPTLSHSFTDPKFTSRDTIFINKETRIALKAYDSESGMHRIEYRIGSDEIKTYENPFSIADEGVYQVSFTGYDNVENTSSSEFFFKVDNTGPVISYQHSIMSHKMNKSSSGTTKIYPKHLILFLSASDNEVGLNNMTYQINNSNNKTYTGPISGFTSGEKTIKITAWDKLGNSSETSLNFIIE